MNGQVIQVYMHITTIYRMTITLTHNNNYNNNNNNNYAYSQTPKMQTIVTSAPCTKYVA